MLEEGESLEDWLRFEQTNLLHVPRTPEGETLTYIGRLTGYYFQAYGADALYLFTQGSCSRQSYT